MASVRIDSIEPDLSRMTRLWIWVLIGASMVCSFYFLQRYQPRWRERNVCKACRYLDVMGSHNTFVIKTLDMRDLRRRMFVCLY